MASPGDACLSAVGLVVPCYNEERRFRGEELAKLLLEVDLHLWLVDDGSTDATLALLRELEDAHAGAVTVLALPSNRGKAEAVRAGLSAAAEAGAAWIGYLDADLAVPVSEVRRLLTNRRDGVDGVLGSRVRLMGYQVERSPVRHVIGRAFGTFASTLLGVPVYDTQCGAKLFRVTPELTAALKDPFETRWMFDVELLARLLYGPGAGRSRLVEVPVREWAEVGGGTLGASRAPAIAAEGLKLARSVRRMRRRGGRG